MKAKKLILSSAFVFALMLVAVIAVLLGTTKGAYAYTGSGTEADPYIVTTYADLKDRMANAPTDSKCYIKLGADILEADINNLNYLALTADEQDVVLDLAGHSLTRAATVTADDSLIEIKYGTLTIEDSLGTGGIYIGGNQLREVINAPIGDYNGNLIINGGIISAENSTKDYAYGVYMMGTQHVTVNGGTFIGKGTGEGFDHAGGHLVVYGGDFSSTGTGAGLSFSNAGTVQLYNLTAHGQIYVGGVGSNIWSYIPLKKVLVDSVEQDSEVATWQFVGDNIVIVGIAIDTVEVTGVTVPTYGMFMAYTAQVSPSANYTIVNESQSWLRNGAGQYQYAFWRETEYTAYLRLQPKEGYYFKETVTGTLNGETATVEEWNYDDSQVEVTYDFPATGTVMTATLNNFYAGAQVAAVTITDESYMHTATIATWYDTNDVFNTGSAEELGPTDVLGLNNTYVLVLRIGSNHGYAVLGDNDNKPVVKGAEGKVGGIDGDYRLWYYAVTVTAEPFATEPSDDTAVVSNDCITTFDDGVGADYYTVTYYNTSSSAWMVVPSAMHLTEKEFSAYSMEPGTTTYRIEASNTSNYLLALSDTFTFTWTAGSHMVTYESNGGSGTMVGDMVDDGDTFTLDPCTFEAPVGQHFKGWAINSPSATPLKQAGDVITITELTTIYAIWEDDPTVTGLTASYSGGNIVKGNKIDGSKIVITATLSDSSTTGVAPDDAGVSYWVGGAVVADPINYVFNEVGPLNVTVKYAGQEAIMALNIVEEGPSPTAHDVPSSSASAYPSPTAGATASDNVTSSASASATANKSGGGLGGGAIAGIIIGAVVVLGAAGFCVYWFLLRKKA